MTENAQSPEPVVESATLPATAPTPKKPEHMLLKVAAERHALLLDMLQHGAQAQNLDVEFVHDVRVTARRLGEVVGLLTVLIDKLTARVVAVSLKNLRRAAGDLRDLDVTCEHLIAGGKWRMPAAVRKMADERVAELHARRAELEGKLKQHLTAASVTGAMVLLAQVIEEQTSPTKLVGAEMQLDKELARLMVRRQKQLRKEFGRAAKKQTPEALHEARIAAKKLRYVLELADAAGFKKHKQELKFLKNMQQLLGDHHDVHVILQDLGRRIVEKGALLRGLRPAWRKWCHTKQREQSKRAVEFLMRSHAWLNKPRQP